MFWDRQLLTSHSSSTGKKKRQDEKQLHQLVFPLKTFTQLPGFLGTKFKRINVG